MMYGIGLALSILGGVLLGNGIFDYDHYREGRVQILLGVVTILIGWWMTGVFDLWL